MTYIVCSVAMVIVAYLAYTQGHINGTQAGKEQVIEEDLIRLNARMNAQYNDKDNAMIDNLLTDTPEEHIEFEQQILAACEQAARGEDIC